jgi:DNA primase
MHLPEELSQEVTSILMNEEREVLHNWEVQQIYVKQKEATISQYVTETIITLRWYLVNNIIDELKNNLSTEEEQDNKESLEMVIAYLGLTHIFSKSLGRVLSRYH